MTFDCIIDYVIYICVFLLVVAIDFLGFTFIINRKK